MSEALLQEFMKLDEEMQLNLVLIKSTQLLLANILCQIATNKNELIKVTDEQGREIKELTLNCAHTGFANNFRQADTKYYSRITRSIFITSLKLIPSPALGVNTNSVVIAGEGIFFKC